jgi:hypothetical protein
MGMEHAARTGINRLRIILAAAMVSIAGVIAVARGQFQRRRGPVPAPSADGPVNRGNIPTWPVDEQFRGDLFTFARVRYRSTWERQSLAWYTDYPDADLNMSFRLQQFTSLRVNPEPRLLELTDPELFDYPWLFMSGVGNIIVDEHEAERLRTYLLRGGFLMVDDFWGEGEWDQFYRALKQVFPDREPEDLPRSHPIFHCLFDIPDDRPLQTTNIGFAIRNRGTGITWEREDAKQVHYRAVFDDKRRMMVMICHNTDTGDGWEEEGTDEWFFKEYSENKCYPLGFNIIFYALTR